MASDNIFDAQGKLTPETREVINDLVDQAASLPTLTEREETFVEAYLACGMKGSKAIRVLEGRDPEDMTTSQADASHASSMLKKQSVWRAIRAAVEERKQRLQLDGDLVLDELACIGYASLGTVMGADGYIDHQKLANAPAAFKRAISQLEQVEIGNGEFKSKLKLKMSDKVRALELLGKNQRLFVDRVEESGPYGAPKVVKVVFVRPGDVENSK